MGELNIDFLLPNGFIVKMPCERKSTLGELRTPLWEKAVEFPAANRLRNVDAYVFIGVTVDAEELEFDDSCHVGELKLIYPVLEVSVPKEKRDSRRLHNKVAEAMGIKIETIDVMQDEELQTFRRDIKPLCCQAVKTRENWSKEQQLLFHHPPVFDINPDLPMNTVKQFEQRDNKLKIRIWSEENERTNVFEIQAELTATPSDIITMAVSSNCRQRSLSHSMTTSFVEKSRQKFALNVRGKQEYLLKECCIHMYKYIRDCISQNTIPDLCLVDRGTLYRQTPDNSCLSLQTESQMLTSPVKECVKSSWELSHDKYMIKVSNLPVRKLDYPDLTGWCVQAQLYHGTTELSRAISTLDHGYNQIFDFDITIQNLPRCSRLCFTICTTSRTGKSQPTLVGMFWVNMQVFNHKGHLVTGDQSLGVWQFPAGQSPSEYPQGSPGGNTNQNCQVLKFTVIPPKSCERALVVFPSKDEIDTTIKREEQFLEYTHEPVSFNKIDKIMAIDPVAELSPEFKKFLWQNRWLAKEYAPNILPRILQCVNWKDRSSVFEFYTLLKRWPREELTIATVLQLLNCQYPDVRVRSLAVWCLDAQITDQLLDLFLLQLVQTLKFECYMHNELCRYLLYKALLNKTIGQTFFWLLRSELQNPVSRQRFAPVLEAYCSYCGTAILDKMIQDVRILNRNIEIAVGVKSFTDYSTQNEALKALLVEDSSRVLDGTCSLFDQMVELDRLIPEKCSVLCSKKRPLWLTWKNKSPNTEDTDMEKMSFIFKHGDDLRQDMMVMRLITVMDMVWKYSCHDYRMIKYGCLAMGDEIGMIEVVKNAKTVNDVRKALKASALNEWLHNENRERFSEAVKTFTYSCAGYCVASFVLGIKDRHPDNIMITKQGQVFHIDFGHITNHAKIARGLGIRRERVPFILTDDFIRVVASGKENPKSTSEFKNFVFLCYEAYMQLRRYSSLLLTLLQLMMQSNLPELSTRSDIDEIREALAVDKSDGEATNFFLKMFEAAYGGAWTTQIDWFLHNLNMLLKKGTGS